MPRAPSPAAPAQAVFPHPHCQPSNHNSLRIEQSTRIANASPSRQPVSRIIRLASSSLAVRHLKRLRSHHSICSQFRAQQVAAPTLIADSTSCRATCAIPPRSPILPPSPPCCNLPAHSGSAARAQSRRPARGSAQKSTVHNHSRAESVPMVRKIMWRVPCPAPNRCSATAPALASFSILHASPNSS